MLTRREYNMLRWAVNAAGDWRGSLTGNPDTTELIQFDLQMKECKKILLKLKPFRRATNVRVKP